jgi:hypothetical protein
MNDFSYILQYFIACFSLYKYIYSFFSSSSVFVVKLFVIVYVTLLKCVVHMFC